MSILTERRGDNAGRKQSVVSLLQWHSEFAAGILGAAIAGGIIAAIHAFLSVTLKVNQVVSGLSLSMFATGVSGYLGKPIIGVAAPVSVKSIPIPGLSKIPVLGPMFFNHNLLVYGSYVLVAFLWYFVYKTRPGLHMRSVGESPRTADSLGINVSFVQYTYTIIGGAGQACRRIIFPCITHPAGRANDCRARMDSYCPCHIRCMESPSSNDRSLSVRRD